MTDAHSTTVMISHPMLGAMQGGLEGAGYKVVRRWDMTPAEAREVRAIVHAGVEEDRRCHYAALELFKECKRPVHRKQRARPSDEHNVR